jgi:hypothetical protein
MWCGSGLILAHIRVKQRVHLTKMSRLLFNVGCKACSLSSGDHGGISRNSVHKNGGSSGNHYRVATGGVGRSHRVNGVWEAASCVCTSHDTRGGIWTTSNYWGGGSSVNSGGGSSVNRGAVTSTSNRSGIAAAAPAASLYARACATLAAATSGVSRTGVDTWKVG